MDPYHIDGHKMLYHLGRIVSWQKTPDGCIPPIYLEVSLTSHCNHRCIFCAVDFAKKEPQHIDMRVLINFLSKAGNAGVKSVMFAGEGEPLLHPQIIDIIKQTTIDKAMTTNGSLGTPEIWSAILPELKWLRFSLDAGDAKTYQTVHGVSQPTFEKTLQSIDNAVYIKRQSGFAISSTVGVQFLVLKENFPSLPTAIEECIKLGVDNFSIKPFSRHPQTVSEYDCIYGKNIVKEITTMIAPYQNQKMKIIFRQEAFDRYSKPIAFTRCLALPFWGYVQTNGDFYTCSVHMGNEHFKTGNIYTDLTNRIFFGSRRAASIRYGDRFLDVSTECRKNCRMARVNEFLEQTTVIPEYKNFI